MGTQPSQSIIAGTMCNIARSNREARSSRLAHRGLPPEIRELTVDGSTVAPELAASCEGWVLSCLTGGMSAAGLKPFSLPEEMAGYLSARNSKPSEQHQSLIEIANDMPHGGMRLGTEAGTFLTILTQAMQPNFVVEVGTFIGYSSLSMASALTGDAQMLCCDVSEEWTLIARQHWEAAGVADRIKLVIAPALKTLQALPAVQPVDLAFIDADKTSYIDYYEELVPRLSQTGVMLVDNTMWSGSVIDETDNREDTVAIRAFNDHVAADARTTNVTIPIGDGVTMVSLANSVCVKFETGRNVDASEVAQ